MRVSVIITVLNEEKNVERLLESLSRQTRLPDEVVICDGGSADHTLRKIENFATQARLFPVEILVEPGANISRGRNVAINAARGPLIAVTDVGVTLDEAWLEHLLKPWQAVDPSLASSCRPALNREAESDEFNRRDTSTQKTATAEGPVAVAGFFLPDISNVFTAAMGATVLPLLSDVDPRKFMPSSRSVAFTKEAWRTAGGYPEWLDYCEDLLFDIAINGQRPQSQTAFSWAPDALVYFQPRSNLRSFWTQYYRYARGDGKADLWRKRHLIRYVTYVIIVPALVGHALWGLTMRWLGWFGLLCGIMLYCYRPWQRLLVVASDLNYRHKILAALLVPLIRFVGDVAKMVGYPVGLLWRWRNRLRPEIHWRK